jgi:hypothetical protein
MHASLRGVDRSNLPKAMLGDIGILTGGKAITWAHPIARCTRESKSARTARQPQARSGFQPEAQPAQYCPANPDRVCCVMF